MGRPWDYPRWRRVLMQVMTWLVLGGTVGLAQLVIHVKTREALTLGPPVRYGLLVVRFPQGWTVQEVSGSQGPAIEATEDGQLMVIEQWVTRRPAELAPESNYDPKQAGSTEKIQFAGLHREGQMQLVPELRPTPDGMAPEEYLTASAVVPLRRGSLLIRVELLKVGPRIGPGERELLLKVVNSLKWASDRSSASSRSNMRHTCLAWLLASGMILYTTARISAADIGADPQSNTLPSAGELPGGELLGGTFDSDSAGISLRLPGGLHRVNSTGAGDDIGHFGDDKRKWELKLTRLLTPKPAALTNGTDGFGKPVVGLLDVTVGRVKHDLAGCKVLRQDLTNIRDGDPSVKDNVAMIAVRYSANGPRFLSQQAIIQASDRLFYLISLTTPASDATGEDAPEDPGERIAVETFRQMLDSVRLLDTEKIALEQRDRLYRTRALMTNWKHHLAAVLIPEQWVRVLRDGKDVGYSYISEQTAAGVPRPLKRQELREGKGDRDLVQSGDGILIGIRARSLNPAVQTGSEKPRGPVQVDTASWLFVAPDFRLEDWSRVTVIADGTVDKEGKPVHQLMEDFASSNKQLVRSLNKEALPGTKIDPRQPAVSVREQYTLDVTSISGSGADEPTTQELPPWYLPQAISHLLPQLLPLDSRPWPDGSIKPRTYLFAVYVPETRQVMHRYVDVGLEQQLTFNGKVVRAIPIDDRIGYHGSVTTHYMTRAGKYLGSENKDTHVLLLPSDAQTLLSIWKNANLTQPGGTERPQGAASAHPPAEPPPFGPQEQAPH